VLASEPCSGVPAHEVGGIVAVTASGVASHERIQTDRPGPEHAFLLDPQPGELLWRNALFHPVVQVIPVVGVLIAVVLESIDSEDAPIKLGLDSVAASARQPPHHAAAPPPPHRNHIDWSSCAYRGSVACQGVRTVSLSGLRPARAFDRGSR